MRSPIVEQLKKEERSSFMKLEPADRVLRMERLLYELLSIKAANEKVTKREIYRQYLGRDKRRRRAV